MNVDKSFIMEPETQISKWEGQPTLAWHNVLKPNLQPFIQK